MSDARKLLQAARRQRTIAPVKKPVSKTPFFEPSPHPSSSLSSTSDPIFPNVQKKNSPSIKQTLTKYEENEEPQSPPAKKAKVNISPKFDKAVPSHILLPKIETPSTKTTTITSTSSSSSPLDSFKSNSSSLPLDFFDDTTLHPNFQSYQKKTQEQLDKEYSEFEKLIAMEETAADLVEQEIEEDYVLDRTEDIKREQSLFLKRSEKLKKLRNAKAPLIEHRQEEIKDLKSKRKIQNISFNNEDSDEDGEDELDWRAGKL